MVNKTKTYTAQVAMEELLPGVMDYMELGPRPRQHQSVSKEKPLKNVNTTILRHENANCEWGEIEMTRVISEVRSNDYLHPTGLRTLGIPGLSLAEVKSWPAHDTGACHVVFYLYTNTPVLCLHQTRWRKLNQVGTRALWLLIKTSRPVRSFLVWWWTLTEKSQ